MSYRHQSVGELHVHRIAQDGAFTQITTVDDGMSFFGIGADEGVSAVCSLPLDEQRRR